MQQPDPAAVQIESVVRPGDVNPEDRSGSGLLVVAPWEFALVGVSGHDEAYTAHWVCPRCLDTGFLGHQVELETPNAHVSCASDENRDDRDYLHIPDELLDGILAAEAVDLTVNPSIGCRCCGFHCYLEESEYRVLSDWNGADDGRDPSATFTNRIQKLKNHREDAYQRLAELVEGVGPRSNQ
jgi:hypothetical protein